jgi:hypothetical protein
MSAMRREVYEAFRAAGVSDEKAAAAAEAIEASRDEGRLRDVEGRLSDVQGRLSNVEGRLRDVEGRLRHVEEELLRLDGRVMLLTWMIGFNLALTAGVLARLLFIH